MPPPSPPTVQPHLSSLVTGAAGFGELVHALRASRRVVATGVAGSAPALLAAALAEPLGKPILLVTAHVDDADEAADELAALDPILLPALESLPGESSVSLELFAARIRALHRLGEGAARVIIAPIHALMQTAPDSAMLGALHLRLAPGLAFAPGALFDWLDRAGYARREAIEEPGEFARRGGIVDIFPVGGTPPLRVEYFGDEIENLHEIDLDSMGSDARLPRADLVAARPELARLDRGGPVTGVLPRAAVVLLHETLELAEQARGYYERVYDAGQGVLNPRDVLKVLETQFAALAEMNQFSHGATGADTRITLGLGPLPEFSRDASEAVASLAEIVRAGTSVRVLTQNDGERQRFDELRREFAPGEGVSAEAAYLHRGFVIRPGSGAPLALVPYHELLHRFQVRRRSVRLAAARTIDAFLDVQPGDYVVHADHGIARFVALAWISPREGARPALRPGPAPPDALEYMTLEFADRARLHVPLTQIDLVQKYVGSFRGKPTLSTLGGARWKNQKDRVRDSVKDLAAELLRVRAARESLPGIAFPGDTAWQQEFEAEFPYEETEDQLAALAAIKKDMHAPRPMDRLVCGDVGFGKTELAIRAAFKACESGRQVAVLVPTTLLAEQHERTFRARFSGYPFSVESLSRFKTGSEASDVLRRLARGQVDVIIGTHRILSKDVAFADLGLVVIDEEQRFGVEHKEELLRLRLTADVLTLSATPIPRTLHMAMLGIRDISSLTTAPADRRAIVTEVASFSETRIARALARELAREGQAYIVHNRISDIFSFADRIRALAPGARVVVGHGQMPGHELEEVMVEFLRGPREGGAHILVSTTIIESGIDIPTANTIIINDAHRFGLSDLHQLRGRVGRHKHRAYCYLLLPEGSSINEIAKRRLKAIEEFSMLGAGFKIAMRDLEIRGAGNILGAEQSGHIAAVGYDMYCRLLEQSVKQLRNEKIVEPPSATTVDLGVSAVIPTGYIAADQRRMEAYRRLASAASPAELDAVERDLAAAYGSAPRQVERLLDLARIRVASSALGVRSINRRDPDILFRTDAPQRLVDHFKGAPGTVTALPPPANDRFCEVYFRPPPKYLEGDTLLTVLRTRLCGGPA
ncbi:MAG: transcription-repair coupling factor [Phycisphaerales bacterium]|nr:transcription-repair coupling factor [Phycisphaerales bacterium]